MAFFNGFPASYQPMYQVPQYQAPVTQAQQQAGGFIRVQNENEARMYPVAPGNSVTFINENAPYCYTKSVDLSQLDRPKFEKYRLVKEEDAPDEPGESKKEYALKDEVNSEISRLEKMIKDFCQARESFSDRLSQSSLNAPSMDADSVVKS